MTDNFLAYGGKIIAQVIGEVLYFPIWWYSVGLGRLLKKVFNYCRDQEESLGLFVWAKNIFVPMYGQHDLGGRVISFFVRLVQIIVRSFIMLIWLAVLLAVVIIWLVFPLLIVMAMVFQLWR